MLKIIVSSSLLILYSCKNEKQLDKFEVPKVIQLDRHDTVEYVKPKGILGVYPDFINKFKFSRALKINFDSIRKDYISLYNTYEKSKNDGLNSDGFQIIVDYNSDIAFSSNKELRPYHHVFPIYIVNETKHTKLLLLKDTQVFATQEAYYDYEWQPIEMDGFDMCGNGGWGLPIHPNEFAMFVMNKYKGNYKTNIRTKVRIGSTIYYSLPYEGYVDTVQCTLRKYVSW